MDHEDFHFTGDPSIGSPVSTITASQGEAPEEQNGAPFGGDGSPEDSPAPFDYTYVSTTARIAVYDDLRSAPRVTEIKPAETASYIETLASTVYTQAKQAGGSVPYTVIKEVSENFIHARFKEIVVSVLDHGCTIRFADQGPGIAHKDKAQLPGFSSAIEPMKKYIRGVGSGLPLVKDYLEFSHGNITIEDNMGAGAVVTISMTPHDVPEAAVNARPTQAPDSFSAAAGGLDPHSQEGVIMAPADPYSPQASSFNLNGASGYLQEAPQGTALLGGAGAAGYSGTYYRPQEGNARAPYPQVGMNPASAPQVAGGITEPAATMYAPTQFGDYQTAQPSQNQALSNQGFYPMQNNAGGYAPYDPTRTFQSLNAHGAARTQMALAPLSQKERDFLPILLSEGAMGITDMKEILEMPASSIHGIFKKLEQAGLVEQRGDKKRDLTPLGREVATYVYSL